MKVGSPTIRVGYKGVLLAFIIVAGSVMTPAYCQTHNISLLVQQTPNEGGAVSPNAGVYAYEANSEITLTATPSPGYEFLYWLGDVSNHEANSTIVHLDKPKIVVAVFEQAQGGIDVSGIPGGGGGGSMTTASSSGIIQPASLSSTTGAKPQGTVYASGAENPPVIPEPATGILLTLGSVFAFSKRRRKKKQ